MTQLLPPGAQVVLVRHGQTEWSLEGRHTGWKDIPLNDSGVREAEALAPWIARLNFSAVLCSPLQRARMTAAICGLAEAAEIDANLREWSYGEYEGRTLGEVRAEDPDWRLWRDGAPGGESVAQIEERADAVVARVKAMVTSQPSGGLVAAFAHGHIIRAVTARWLNRDLDLGAQLALGTASVGILGGENGNPSICGWNWKQLVPAGPPG